MKTYDEVYELLSKSILERFRVVKDQLGPDVKLKDDLELDSLDMADLLCEIEDQYGKEIIDGFNGDKELQQKWYEAYNGTMDDMCKFFLEAINKLEEQDDSKMS